MSSGINDLAVINKNVMITVGPYGVINKSADAGKSWRNIPVNAGNPLNKVQFTTTAKGYCAGGYGVWKTEDQGESWFPVFTVQNEYEQGITGMYFTGADSGFFVSKNGLIYSTADGGRTIHTIMQLGYGKLNSIDFINDSIGIVGGDDFILKTSDAGKTWQRIDLTDINYSVYVSKAKFMTPLIAYGLCANGYLLKSVDGGNTWNVIYKGGDSFTDLYFFDDNNGMFISNSGGVYKTKDGGLHLELDITVQAGDLGFQAIKPDPYNGRLLIVGSGIYRRGSGILSSVNKGASWETINNNARSYRPKILQALNDSVLFAGGESGIMMKSNDYGESWLPLQNVPSPYGNDVYGFWFSDSLTGYASTGNSYLYKTKDGAKTWDTVSLPLDINGSNFFPRQVRFKDSLNGMIMNNSIYTTTNGGRSWKLEDIFFENGFLIAWGFKKDGQGFAVGYNGCVAVSDNNGLNWKKYNLKTTNYLTSVYFYNNRIGFIGTADTAIYKTIDGGVSWRKIYTGIEYLQMVSFAFKDSLNGYMVGNNQGGLSNIYFTKDGGESWQFLTQESVNISGIVGEKNFYFAGYDGLVARFDKQLKPLIPGYINGPLKVCTNEVSSYKVPSMYNEEYKWSLSGDGVQITKGQYDTIVFTNPGIFNLSVAIKNNCGIGPLRTIQVEVVDFKPSITITDSSLNVTKGSYYKWYLNDTLIAAGSGDSSSMLFAERAGFYKTEVVSGFGCSRFTEPVYYKPAPVHNIRSGNWSVAANWSNRRVPGPNTDVLLNFNIIVDQDATCKSLKTGSYQIHINKNANLSVTGRPK